MLLITLEEYKYILMELLLACIPFFRTLKAFLMIVSIVTKEPKM